MLEMLCDSLVTEEGSRVRVLAAIGPEDPGELVDWLAARPCDGGSVPNLKERRSVGCDDTCDKRARQITGRGPRLLRGCAEVLLSIEDDSRRHVLRDFHDERTCGHQFLD